MTALTSNTPVLVTEVNPHRQTSSVWTGATTVGEVISVVAQKTACSTTQPGEFLLKNAKKSLAEFVDADGEFDGDKYNEWEQAQSLDARFEAAIDCESDDGHTVRVYWTKQDALDAGAPRYMSEEEFERAVNLVFGE